MYLTNERVEYLENAFGPTLGLFLVYLYIFLLKFIPIFIYFVIGIAFYQSNEGWNNLDCVYFIVTTAATGKHATNSFKSIPLPDFNSFMIDKLYKLILSYLKSLY